MRASIALALLLFLLPGVALAQAEKRIALLIGNQAYTPEIGALQNPHNDVALLERTLKSLGFQVTTVRDADLATLTRAVNAYTRRLAADGGQNAVGFFYYSGHGAADGTTNYLIPIDVKTTETGELWDQSLRLTEITRKLRSEAGSATHFVVFDACRNTLKLRKPGTRALVQSKGFVPVMQENGMLIAYATAEGELASDVGDGAGPYAKALAEEIVKPGAEAVVMFRAVQRRVRTAIGQEPYLGFNAMGDVYLAGTEAPKLPPAITQAAQEWERVDKTSSVELETFVRRHGSSPEADYARARIAALTKQVVSSAPKAKQPAPMGGMSRCESLSERAVCEFDPSCLWVDDKKQCQRKSGSLAAAMLESPPASMPKSDGPCVEALVGKEKRCLKPGDSFRDCPECPEMVAVPAGSFMRGSPENEEKHENDEGPMHEVTIGKPFAVGKFEVTLDEWGACVAAGDCSYKANGVGKQPVSNVSWYDITNGFLPWLSRTAGRTYRLLTEAEWEYAARAGTTTPFSTGRTITPEQANFDGRESYGGSAKGVYRMKTVEVGTFQPNFFGLYDMHGNVSEWVEDCYKVSYASAPSDGSAVRGDCASRVLRGGSFSGGPWLLRSAKRFASNPGLRTYNQGFRLARTLSQ